MNYIRQLTAFFDAIANDKRLNPSHISLYMAMFQYWNLNRFVNPISIARNELMRISKLSAQATYHKCIKELHEFGYIQYEPSYNPFRGSLVFLNDLDKKPVQKTEGQQAKKQTSTIQVLASSLTKINTGTEQALAPSINNTKQIKQEKGVNKETPANEIFKNDHLKNKNHLPPPKLAEVEDFFKKEAFPTQEAVKFFSHYQTNGWLQGGKTPILDWQAAGINWMLNAQKFNRHDHHQLPRANHLNTANNKNYAEPL